MLYIIIDAQYYNVRMHNKMCCHTIQYTVVLYSRNHGGLGFPALKVSVKKASSHFILKY